MAKSKLFVVFLSSSLLLLLVQSQSMEKYLPLKQKCQRTPKDPSCLQLKAKFTQLSNKCSKLQSKEQIDICRLVKEKLCYIFPVTCRKPTTKGKAMITTPTTTTTTSSTTVSRVLVQESDEEFVQVPVQPEALRIRGEYCLRHGKEKKCQELLVNLKKTYSACQKKKVESSSPKAVEEKVDCHSFQSHLCKAFPKFPPCLQKTSSSPPQP